MVYPVTNYTALTKMPGRPDARIRFRLNFWQLLPIEVSFCKTEIGHRVATYL
jgi:hypothetical protein